METQSRLLEGKKYRSLLTLVKLALNCGLSAFYYGYCLTSFNSINFDRIVAIFHLEHYPRALTQGVLTGSTCFTAALGTILTTHLIARFSRRESLMILSCLAIVLSTFSLIPTALMLFVARLGQGFAIGSISCITPLYMKEIMPKEISGPLWSLHQVMFVLGASFGFFLTFLLGLLSEPEQSWRIIFGLPILTCVLQLINFAYFYRLDTPKWYILKGRKQQAREAIQFIYEPAYVDQILKDVMDANSYSMQKAPSRDSTFSQACQAEIEMELIEAEGAKKGEQKMQQIKQITESKVKNNSLAVFAAFYLIGQQHLLGGVTVMQYSPELTLKIMPSLERMFPAFVSMVGLAGSLYSIQIMRNRGRKETLLVGTLVSTASLGTAFLIFRAFDLSNPEANMFFFKVVLLVVMILIRLSMSCAMGPIPWLYIAEVVQPNMVPWCFLLNWAMLGSISIAFPILCDLNAGNPSLAFSIFATAGVVSFFVNKRVLIQTKNKTQLEIRKQYDQLCS